MSEAIGYIAAALIGVSLGLLGGGGSILTVPMLVYLFHLSPGEAAAYSLFIVGTTASIGGLTHARRGNVDLPRALSFALPSVAGVYLMRRLITPAVPRTLFTIGSASLTKERATLLLFIALMFAAGAAMIRRRSIKSEASEPQPMRLGLQGFATGLVTGAVGAGGGFLIVPALVVAAQMPMKRAVATSLVVIAASSLLGFVGDLQAGRTVAWDFLLSIASIAIAGSFLGSYAGRLVSGERLKPIFGYLVLVMGIGMLAAELFR